MRAGRLLTILSILQREGRTTARDLAARLEVTPRTVLRDVEALSEAGVPVFTVQGTGGGIELLDGFGVRLAGLPAEAADGLLLLGAPDVATALGRVPRVAAARHAVLAALPPALVPRATAVERWFLRDAAPEPGPDDPDAVPQAVTRALADALAAGCRALLRTRDGDEPVAPLGLVLSGRDWYLVHLAEAGRMAGQVAGQMAGRVAAPAARPLKGVVEAVVVQRPVERPADFDLAATWRQLCRTISGAGHTRRGPGVHQEEGAGTAPRVEQGRTS